jgi:hypothetical protein
MSVTVTLLRFFLRCLGTCSHPFRYRERERGVLMLTCEDCGDSVPAIARTKAERKRLTVLRPSHETMRARPAHPAKVLTMGKRP